MVCSRALSGLEGERSGVEVHFDGYSDDLLCCTGVVALHERVVCFQPFRCKATLKVNVVIRKDETPRFDKRFLTFQLGCDLKEGEDSLSWSSIRIGS